MYFINCTQDTAAFMSLSLILKYWDRKSSKTQDNVKLGFNLRQIFGFTGLVVS